MPDADRDCGHPNHGHLTHNCAPFLPSANPPQWVLDMEDAAMNSIVIPEHVTGRNNGTPPDHRPAASVIPAVCPQCERRYHADYPCTSGDAA